jgi:endonuclease III
MDEVYGGSDNWARIVEGGEAKLQEAIKCGGLSVVKSKVITSILRQVHEKYGKYSLDHLHDAETEEAYKELLAFQGVGPKTASCVLLFCLRRESFAVDTHVWRIVGLLGWRPKEAGREATQQHLEVRVPPEEKYGLHVLMVTHGKRCEECRAGGKSVGKCELRKAFRKEKVEKEEEIQVEEETLKEESEE